MPARISSSVSFCSVCAFSAIFLSFISCKYSFMQNPVYIHIKQVIIFRNILDYSHPTRISNSLRTHHQNLQTMHSHMLIGSNLCRSSICSPIPMYLTGTLSSDWIAIAIPPFAVPSSFVMTNTVDLGHGAELSCLL